MKKLIVLVSVLVLSVCSLSAQPEEVCAKVADGDRDANRSDTCNIMYKLYSLSIILRKFNHYYLIFPFFQSNKQVFWKIQLIFDIFVSSSRSRIIFLVVSYPSSYISRLFSVSKVS